MKIPITIIVHDQTVSTNTLIDSGAEGKFIDAKFIIKHCIPTKPLAHPIQVRNVDGTPNQHGTITQFTWRLIKIGGRSITTTFLVTSLGKEDVILGLPWLKRHNPTINWTTGTLSINKVTTATTLAREHTKPTLPLEIQIPSKYHEYLHIFQKKAAECFPISQPYNHAIDLKTNFIPRDCKLYPLSPKEQLALDQFLKDNLHYRMLNEGTIKNAYPLPLISELMDKLKGTKYFTKLDLRSGYNNICIKNGDQWKAAFKMPRRLFEPTVMFFGLCNSPATFQAFMDDTFCIVILEDNVLIYMDDIFIFASNLQDLHQKTLHVLDICTKNDLYCKPEKCLFAVQEAEFLGMIITPNNINMDPVKLSALLIPDPSKPFILETDASKVATGAVLYQTNSNGDLQPCGFISQTLGPAQQHYEVYD
ncbi:hypothetical protein M0805_005953 [Coniferiporia weirii]|nr:hypothetical protein M0805_005953 [Coniferiporia weirii]